MWVHSEQSHCAVHYSPHCMCDGVSSSCSKLCDHLPRLLRAFTRATTLASPPSAFQHRFLEQCKIAVCTTWHTTCKLSSTAHCYIIAITGAVIDSSPCSDIQLCKRKRVKLCSRANAAAFRKSCSTVRIRLLKAGTTCVPHLLEPMQRASSISQDCAPEHM
jgi:hypothetical protein